MTTLSPEGVPRSVWHPTPEPTEPRGSRQPGVGQTPPHSWSAPPLKADSRGALPLPREREMGCATGWPPQLLLLPEPIPSPLWHPDLLCGCCLCHPCQLPPTQPGQALPASPTQPEKGLPWPSASPSPKKENQVVSSSAGTLGLAFWPGVEGPSTGTSPFSPGPRSRPKAQRSWLEPSLPNRHPSLTCHLDP